MLLGYLPDRAYYFTVQQTVDLGLLLWSPINFCPPSNVHLPCPVPVGATLPWQPSPPEIQLPAGRADGVAAVVGQTYLYAGGTDGKAAVPDVYFAKAVGDGNLDGWKAAPPLPEARSAAAAAVIGTTMYVIGGYGPDGKPTDTTYSITVANDGSLGEWATVDVAKLPVPLAGLSAAAVSDGIVVMGGTDGTAPSTNVWKTQLTNTAPATLQAWVAQNPLVEPNVDGAAFHVGDYIYLVGGSNASGPVATVQVGTLGGPGTVPANPNQMNSPWKYSAQTNLPGPRTNLSGFTSNGTIYIQGGSDGTNLLSLHAVGGPQHQRRDPPVADAVADRPRAGRPGLGGDGRGLARVHRGRPRLGRPDRRRGPHEPRARRRRSSSWACWARPCRASSSTARSASRSAT